MATQVKGVRANKPNDSFGVTNNKNLYRGKYRDDVYKDDEENTEETQDPTQEVATQEKSKPSENSFAEAKQQEDHDYKKRYDDLKKHYDTKLNEFKSEREQLMSELETFKQHTQELPRGATPPKTLEELEEFKEKYPDVFQVVETVAGVQSEAKIAKLRQDLESVKQREKSLEKEKAFEELLRLHPDFDDLKTNEKFLGWLDEQPTQLSDGIYKNNTDAKWAGKVVSLYKAEMGISNKKPTRSKDSDAAASVIRQQPKEVATKDSTKKIWKGSDIARLKSWEFEKVEAEIDLARQEGRIDMNS
jgi:hypothetical protein